MLRQFSVGIGVCVCAIVIHAVVMTAVVRTARAVGANSVLHPWLRLSAIMTATVLVLMFAHICEVLVWSLAYALTGAAPPGANLVDFAFVNYTTLGYGDVLPTQDWRLLGPITAMNGILMFGWSTAVIFEVLRRAMERAGPVIGLQSTLE